MKIELWSLLEGYRKLTVLRILTPISKRYLLPFSSLGNSLEKALNAACPLNDVILNYFFHIWNQCSKLHHMRAQAFLI